ncbi:Rrg8p SCDLUD_002336 [Saccharomycodes ludwigii]|uniref:Rrg8p n=1 Tax=Saccharomycodes ludwigii TaxID=36035 RepID=UPI001E8C4FF9|nr:hypothetical protein SCDLUD_002336 [Saccharomycodes ludwigii]KAH3900879.1 hypothetical protein SCDLUD_002336 [Saccharomycodes ludwigii]
MQWNEVSKLLLDTTLKNNKNIVKNNGTKQVPKISPIITKKKAEKIYIPNVSTQRNIPNFQLGTNMLAQLLGSPMRKDRLTMIKSPKDFLLQLKLIRVNDEDLKLDLSRKHSKKGESTYITNKSTYVNVLLPKMTSAIIPLRAVRSSLLKIDAKQIINSNDMKPVIEKYENWLIHAFKAKMGKLLGKLPAESSTDVCIINKNDEEGIQINPNAKKTLIFNIKNIPGSDKYRDISISLSVKTDLEMIKFIYKLIMYYK